MSITVTMCKLFLALIIGIILNKKEILDNLTCKKLSAFVVNITCPALIISSVKNLGSEENESILNLLFIGILLYIALPFISYLLARILMPPKSLRGVYTCIFLFSNSMFMGYPVVESLFGSKAIFYTTILHLPFNLLVFTIGVYLMGNENRGKSKFRFKSIINNGMIAAIIALVIYLSGLELPNIVSECFGFIGGITVPISMILIGANVAKYKINDVFCDVRIYIASIMRLVFIPFLVYLTTNMFTDNKEFIGIATVTFGMPVATIVAMISSGDEKKQKVGSIITVVTTLISFITIPIITILLNV